MHVRLLKYVILVLKFLPAADFANPVLVQRQKVLRIEYTQDCSKNLAPLSFAGMSVFRNGSTAILKGGMMCTRDLQRLLKFHFRVEKCKDKSNPDTCEYHSTWKWDDLCAIMKMPMIKDFADYVEPPVICPLRMNQYRIKDAKFNPAVWEPLFAAETPNTLWKFHFITNDPVGLVCCLEIGIRFAHVRHRGTV
nr:PREDICTED: uncharacterized protein LOC109029708 isoform X2 [Bemisia tabaci]